MTIRHTVLFVCALCAACGSSNPGGDDAGFQDDAGASQDASFVDVSSDVTATDESDANAVDAGAGCGASVACRDGETCVAGACEYAGCVGQNVPGSPAIGVGDASHAPPSDYWGAPRSGSVDLGCVQ
ncbi:MAG TPA: hypothetical protein VGH28_02455 [Polyangiaceae bacterium]|jgi:hypothetical protein